MTSDSAWLIPLGGMMLLVVISGFTRAATTAEKSARDRVDEMVICLAETLLKDSEPEFDAYQEALSEGRLNELRVTCTRKRASAYTPEDTASYAMGVSLQRKLLHEHETLDWVDLINGFLRADSSTVRVSDATIDSVLRETLLGDAEASQQYLEKLAQSEEVEEVSGVLFKKLMQMVPSDAGKETSVSSADGPSADRHAEAWRLAFDRPGLCDDIKKTDSSQRLVRFHLVKPVNRRLDDDDIAQLDVDCIAFAVDDVIRGWRLVIDKLDPLDIYDVLIPSELAYGTAGVPGLVEGGENLRFLMQVAPR